MVDDRIAGLLTLPICVLRHALGQRLFRVRSMLLAQHECLVLRHLAMLAASSRGRCVVQTRGFFTAPQWFAGGTPPPDPEGPDVLAARKRSRDSYAEAKEPGPEPIDAGRVGNLQTGVNVLGGTKRRRPRRPHGAIA